MSERLTIKESVRMIKTAFVIVNKNNKKVFVWSGLGGILIGGLLGSALLANVAVENDLNGERVVHAECNVTDKKTNSTYNGVTFSVSYGAETSCGYFHTSQAVQSSLETGQTYNLTTSAGSWAQAPSILSVELSKNN